MVDLLGDNLESIFCNYYCGFFGYIELLGRCIYFYSWTDGFQFSNESRSPESFITDGDGVAGFDNTFCAIILSIYVTWFELYIFGEYRVYGDLEFAADFSGY